MPNEIDDRINVRVGDALAEKISQREREKDENTSVVVREVLRRGFEAIEREEREKKREIA